VASPSPLALSRSKPSSSPSADRSHRESSVYTRSPLRVATQAFDITHNTSCWPKSSPWSFIRHVVATLELARILGSRFLSCGISVDVQSRTQGPCGPGCGPRVRAGVARRTAEPAGTCGATRRIGFRATLGENERRETERPLRTQSSEKSAFVHTFETPASYYRALRLASRTDGTVRRTRFPFFTGADRLQMTDGRGIKGPGSGHQPHQLTLSACGRRQHDFLTTIGAQLESRASNNHPNGVSTA
jgi:hypothetical protein